MNMLIEKQKFTNWIDRYHGPLFKHALWMTGNRSLAEELVQETFYQAWKSRHGIENDSQPLAWLLTILRRAVYKEHQHARALSAGFAQDSIDSPAVEDPEALLDLGRGLLSLSARQRDILLLHALHGFSYEQIGEQLNIPVGTVMSRISRARQALRGFYAAEEDPVVVPIRKKEV
jgi:RNA polymerase sigma-70 factor (ECF subfamily)